MRKVVNVAVTGAAGQVAYNFLFRLASGEVFGPEIGINLNLLEVEVPQVLDAARGVAMELRDCASSCLEKVIVTDELEIAMVGVDYAVLIGSAPRQKDMDRSALLAKNGEIFEAQGQAINEHASRDVKVLVVGNPCNTNALIAMSHAPDIPRENFFAMTRLDQNRASSILAGKQAVSVSAVKGVIIWGNHSSTQYPGVECVTIDGKPASLVQKDQYWVKNDFIQMVRERGQTIIAARGKSSAGSAATAIVDTLRAITRETPKDAPAYSLACCSTGTYGVPAGLVFSFPCRTVDGKVQIAKGVKLGPEARERLQASVAELSTERAEAIDLGFIPGGFVDEGARGLGSLASVAQTDRVRTFPKNPRQPPADGKESQQEVPGSGDSMLYAPV